MELSSFSENIVVERIERNGDFVELQINIDAIVPDYYEQLEKLLAPMTERREALREKYNELTVEVERRKKEFEKAEKNGKPKKQKPLPSVLAMEKELAEIQRDEFAARLTCPVRLPDGSLTALLKGWNITVNGEAIPPSMGNLAKLPPKTVEEIWKRSIAAADTVKKRVDEQDEETSDTTQRGSKELRVVGQTG
jgi:hypothetical protein